MERRNVLVGAVTGFVSWLFGRGSTPAAEAPLSAVAATPVEQDAEYGLEPRLTDQQTRAKFGYEVRCMILDMLKGYTIATVTPMRCGTSRGRTQPLWLQGVADPRPEADTIFLPARYAEYLLCHWQDMDLEDAPQTLDEFYEGKLFGLRVVRHTALIVLSSRNDHAEIQKMLAPPPPTVGHAAVLLDQDGRLISTRASDE